MRTRTPALYILAACLTLSALQSALSQDKPPPPPFDAAVYTLEAKHVVNEVLKYKMTMNMKMEMKPAKADAPVPNLGDMTSNSIMRMKTAGVRPDGTGVIISQILEGETVAMGRKQSLAGTPPITQEVDKRGRITNMSKLAATGPGAQFLQGLDFKNMPAMGVLLPDHPVKVGDSWEDEKPVPIGNSKGKVTCTLLGTESIQGHDTLKIKQIWVVPLIISLGMDGQPAKDEASAIMAMTGKVTIDSILNILPVNARLIKSSGDMGMKMTMQFKGPLAEQSPFGSSLDMTTQGKMEMTLLSAGKVEPPAAAAAKSISKPAAKKPAAKDK